MASLKIQNRSGVSASWTPFSQAMASSSPRPSLLPSYSTLLYADIPSVVLLIISTSINPILNPSEVQHLFSMPLPSFLYSHPSKIPGWHFGISTRVAAAASALAPGGLVIPPPPPIPYAEQGEAGVVGGGEGRYYGYRDIEWGPGTVRMHRFLTGREGTGVKPVYGLTA